MRISKSKKFGPFRVTGSRSGLSTSFGSGGSRIGGSTSGRKWASTRLAKGLIWRRSRG